MRNRIIILLLAMFSLTACVYDQYKPEYCTDEPIYLSFVLRGTGAPLLAEETKAATTESKWSAQEVAEQLVSRVDLYFYTGAGQYLGKHKQETFTQNWDDSDQNVSNEVGKFAVKLDYRPYRVLVTVNSTVDLTNKTLQQARAILQESGEYKSTVNVSTITYKYGSTDKQVTDVKPFYMSSSTYLNEKKVEVCDILISNAYIHRKQADAMAKPLPIYLERLAAKVNLIVPRKEYQEGYMVPIVTSQDSVTAKVKLVGWALNATNTSSYFFKKVDTSWDYSFNQGTSPSIYWNNKDKYRSYWAIDPNYTAADHAGILIPQQTAALTEDKFVYRKPADLTEGWTEDSVNNVFVGTAYCLENTSGADVLPVVDTDASTLYSRATHIIIKAQLTFDLGAGSQKDDDNFGTSPQTVFRYNGMFYTASGLIKALRRDTYNAADPASSPLHGIEDSDLGFISAHDRPYCKGYDKGERVAVYRKSDNSYPDLKDASGNPVRIDGFMNGYFYYKIPIEHINNEETTASTYPVARYAVVRNHNYQITLGDLKGIGTGIYNENYDIRPFRKTDDYRVTAYVKVSPWTQFETRFLFVDPSGLLVTDGQEVIQWEDEGDPAKDGKGNNVWTGNGWYF